MKRKVGGGIVILVGLALIAVFMLEVGGGDWGRFDGRPVAEWSADGRNMTLLEDFSYVDPRGKTWHAPAGAVVNGASIPRFLWSMLGGPFEGKYRNASVVHDVYCDSMTEVSKDVHFMFYEACRCGGVSEKQAKLMYFAVSKFGPSWQPIYQTAAGSEQPTVRMIVEPARTPTAEEIEQMTAYFEENNPDVRDVPTLKILGGD